MAKEANRKGFIRAAKSDRKYATWVCRYHESSVYVSGHEKCTFFVSIAKIEGVEGGWRVTNCCLEHCAGHGQCTFYFPEGVKNAKNNQKISRRNRTASMMAYSLEGQDYVANRNPFRRLSPFALEGHSQDQYICQVLAPSSGNE